MQSASPGKATPSPFVALTHLIEETAQHARLERRGPGGPMRLVVGNALLLQPVRFDRATELMHPHADKTGKPA
jgi:hypothetical protein